MVQVHRGWRVLGTLPLILLIGATPARSQDDSHDLAKKLSNPVSDLVSVPFQFNWEFGEGPDDDTWQILNVQPVVPFRLSDHTNMIARLIIPTIDRPGQTLSGDMVFSLFFSPAQPKGAIWGLGPVLQLPRTGGKWAVGPTGVLLKQKGHLTYGALVNQAWSFAGDPDAPDFNQAFFQPFFAVNTPNAVTYTLQSEMRADWDAPEGEVWSIPINFVVSKVSHFGSTPASYGIGGGVYVASPEDGPEWKLRAVATLLLPGKKNSGND